MNLQGKACVITGASSGIGLATTRAFASRGARVLAVARNVAPILEAAIHGVEALSLDVSTKEGVDRLFAATHEAIGGIDIFYANAGFAYCERSDAPDWKHLEAIVDLNLLSPLYAFERLRAEKGDGAFTFVATASAMSYMAIPGYAVYGATKAALRMFAQTAAYELGPGQRICTVYPVATKTAFFDRAATAYVPWPTQTPEVVAAAVLRGVERDRQSIFPLRAFPLVHVVLRILPSLRQAFLGMEWKKTGLGKVVAR